MTWGIDISHWQDGANLEAARSAGCQFVIAKATEGLTGKDPAYAGYRAECHRLGLPFGSYHFARPQSGRTGTQEADAFLAVAGDVRPRELPHVLDIEHTELGAAATADFALAWLRRVQDRTGVRPMVYSYRFFILANLQKTALAAYPLWYALYRDSLDPVPPAPPPWTSWRIWQHTNSATVAGIPGQCDRDYSRLSVADLLAGTTTPDQPSTEDEIMSLTPINPATGDPATPNTWASSVWKYVFETYRIVARLAQAQGVDVTALAAALAPLLNDTLPDLDQADLDAIAKAVNDELARRAAA